MTTVTIDIPDNTTEEVITILKKMGVTIRESESEGLNNLTKEDYQKQFAYQAKANKSKLLRHL